MSEQVAIEEFLKRAPEWRGCNLIARLAQDGTDHDRAQCEYVIYVEECVIGRVKRVGSTIYATCIL